MKQPFLRFTLTERLYHWAQALPYLALAVTGGMMMAEKLFDSEVGAKETVRNAHLLCAIAMLVLPFLVFLGGRTSILMTNLKDVLTWRGDDFRWFFVSVKRLFIPSAALPAVGKFNPGQKLNFLAVMATIPLFAASGAMIYFFKGALLAWYVHVILFFVSLVLLAGHIFMAVINPSTSPSLRGILWGKVEEEWVAYHHPAWHRAVRETNRVAVAKKEERLEGGDVLWRDAR